jgi:hypothetical protein
MQLDVLNTVPGIIDMYDSQLDNQIDASGVIVKPIMNYNGATITINGDGNDLDYGKQVIIYCGDGYFVTTLCSNEGCNYIFSGIKKNMVSGEVELTTSIVDDLKLLNDLPSEFNNLRENKFRLVQEID